MKTKNKNYTHLLPRSQASLRQWWICPFEEFEKKYFKKNMLQLNCSPNNHDNFSSFLLILQQIIALNTDALLVERIQELILQINKNRPDGEIQQDHKSFLAHAVTHSIMRRISRESVFTSQIIDKGAKLLNEFFEQQTKWKSIIISDAALLDRLSLKVLIRAMLLHSKTATFSWVWHTTINPLNEQYLNSDSIFEISRYNFFQKAITICQPELHLFPQVATYPKSNERSEKQLLDISYALVVQNYDACFLWATPLFKHPEPEVKAEALRMSGIAAINIGLKSIALQQFELAEETTKRKGKKAHIAYLQGLTVAKRNYDVQNSQAHYQRGLEYLESTEDYSPDDPALERAWLLNGIAMNNTLMGKSKPKTSAYYLKAFNFVKEAFSLIQNKDSNPATYLKYNLIANSTFLLEILGDYAYAVRIFRQVFDIPLESDTWKGRSWKSTLGYRLAGLQFRSGDKEKALDLLEGLEKLDAVRDNPPLYERILRALAFFLLQNNEIEKARIYYQRGLNICRQERSAKGALHHFKSLAACLLLQNKKEELLVLSENLEEEEQVVLGTSLDRPSSELIQLFYPDWPSPKLPAYIPEIDLEDVPAVDLNMYLGNKRSFISEPSLIA